MHSSTNLNQWQHEEHVSYQTSKGTSTMKPTGAAWDYETLLFESTMQGSIDRSLIRNYSTDLLATTKISVDHRASCWRLPVNITVASFQKIDLPSKSYCHGRGFGLFEGRSFSHNNLVDLGCFDSPRADLYFNRLFPRLYGYAFNQSRRDDRFVDRRFDQLRGESGSRGRHSSESSAHGRCDVVTFRAPKDAYYCP